MVRPLRPFTRAVTYTRWLHLFIAIVWPTVWLLVFPDHWLWMVTAAALLAPIALVPAMRTVEGLQARLLLTGDRHDSENSGIVAAPATTWTDRVRTAVWLEFRLLVGTPVAAATVQLPMLSVDLVHTALGGRAAQDTFLHLGGHHWWYALLALLPPAALAVLVVCCGSLTTAVARRLLGPSPAQRLAALEERTEQLLERSRIARELHDSIGHALTVAVVQAGAARAARNAEFTERALAAIEETGRGALEDLERVLGVLREQDRPVSSRPTLAEADRILESARAAGAKVDAELTGPLESLPGPVSREGYRILQESLTNVLRHAGPVPARVRIAVDDGRLVLEVRNPLPSGGSASGGVPAVRSSGRGGGLRGIRERAALLGGHALTGPDADGDWQVRAELPTS